jgi:N-acetylglucosamine-6-phosphate deacetylase
MSGALQLFAERVVTPEGVLAPGLVRVEEGRIAAVEHAAHPVVAGESLTGALLLPGFIDLHWHGAGGRDLRDAEETRQALRQAAHGGVTTCYAGPGGGASLEAIARAVAGLAAVVNMETGGARLAGIFLEGPYISVAKRGAWNPAYLRTPDIDELRLLIEASGGHLRRINVAPELPGALDFIRAARAAGLVVSIGHSDATCEQTLAAVEAGATIANHAFNAMSGLHHRAPGLVGATLACPELLAELILDGEHVHPVAAQALYGAKGAAGVALITDSSPLAGVPDGTYEASGRTLIVRGGSCRLPDGTLAGGIAPFDQHVRNAARWLGAGPIELAMLAAGNAARALGIADRTGAIAVGLDADLVLLDADLHVLATIARGRVVYRREEERG